MSTTDTEFAPRPRTPRGRPASPVTTENPDDLATVDAKIAAFWGLYPDGAIDASDIEQISEDGWRVTAHVWKVAPSKQFDERGVADSTGSSVRTLELDAHASGEYPLESAQSVAIGRALRFMGILATVPGDKDRIPYVDTRPPGEDNPDA